MPQSRLLVLGFDSMDVELVRRWAAAGYLPTFRRLFESAAWTDYIHPPEHLTTTLWTTINTGLGPLRHDFSFSMRYCSDSYRMRMSRADDIKDEFFWEWFARSGRRIVLADATLSIPRAAHGGKQIAGWGMHDLPLSRSSVPKGLLRDLSARFGAHPVPICWDFSTETHSLARLRSGLLTGIERRTAILKSLILGGGWDLFYGDYSEPHCAGHLMWHLEDETHPQHSREQLDTVGHAMRDIYAAIDHSIGELLMCAGDDTISVAFFSHGMGPNYHAEHLFPRFVSRFNRRWQGGNSAEGPGDVDGGWLDSMWQRSVGRAPLWWRHSVRQRLPASLRAWITSKRQQNPRQWRLMPAFSLPSDVHSALRVNLAGRESEGQIQPGHEYRRYLDAFTEQVWQLTNADTGKPAVERIFRADQQVDPVKIGSAPDLIVWWTRSEPFRAIRSATFGTIGGEAAARRTGEHMMRGMFLISHPRAKRGRHAVEGMSPPDIPATLCDLAGIKPGITLDGTSRRHDLLAE